MTGKILLIAAILLQIGFFITEVKTGQRQRKIRLTVYAEVTVGIAIALVTGIFQWDFQFYGLGIVLILCLIIGSIRLKLNYQPRKVYTKGRKIGKLITCCFVSVFLLLPLILFPQYKHIQTTGTHAVATQSFTYIDENRKETYSDKDENRKVTVQFWYPQDSEINETYPLVIFSHGAFGYRMSNESTFLELASNGYVVCSIDHTYHAFFTAHTDGSNVVANMDFLNDVLNSSGYEEEKTYQLSQEWLAIRTADMSLVIDTIIDSVNSQNSDELFDLINVEKIGVSGHSLGGATAAQIGRTRSDISSVICIDGTMLGEVEAYSDEVYTMTEEPYPIPLLNFYSEEHYRQMVASEDVYENSLASRNALESYDIMIKGSGHLNFTDLPIVSPFLGGMLGVGDVDSRYCIETMNELVLQFFDYTLKDAAVPEFQIVY